MHNHSSLATLLISMPAVVFLTCGGSMNSAGDAEQEADVARVAVAEVSAADLRRSVEKLAGFGTRHTRSETDSETRGIGAARRWIESELRSISKANGGRLEVRVQRFELEVPTDGIGGTATTELVNVYGFLPGKVGDRTYLVSGHYDSINGDRFDASGDAPGANDDASGTAIVLEAARVLSKQSFGANLVFLCVPGEEQGLFGSTHFAEQLSAEGLAITAMFTNDIVGGAHGADFDHDHDRVRVFSGGDTPDSPARELSRLIAETARDYVPAFEVRQIHRLDRVRRGGDHIPFHERGMAAVRFTEAREDYRRQHKHVAPDESTGDLPNYVSADYMANVARVNIATLARLASAPAPPGNFRVRGAMSHRTTLSWDPTRGAVAYEVLWRETTALDWKHSVRLDILESTADTRHHDIEMTLEETIDDYYWAVRAIGKGGHAGLPAVGPRK